MSTINRSSHGLQETITLKIQDCPLCKDNPDSDCRLAVNSMLLSPGVTMFQALTLCGKRTVAYPDLSLVLQAIETPGCFIEAEWHSVMASPEYYGPNNIQEFNRRHETFHQEQANAVVQSLVALFWVVLVLFVLSVFALQAFGQPLVRTGTDVVLTAPNGLSMRFVGSQGGVPLHWFRGSLLVSDPHPGAGASIMFDTGNDGTEAGATGMSIFPMAQFGNPALAGYSHWAREEIYMIDGGNGIYQKSGMMPYFWVSHDPIDDAHPTDLRGDHGWSTFYHDILGLGSFGYQNFDAPIYFTVRPGVPSGIILIGDEIKGFYSPSMPWHQRLARIPGGKFSLRIRISMTAGPDAIAGVMLRRLYNPGPADNINTAYSAPGDQLNINRQGVVQLLASNGSVLTSPGSRWAGDKVLIETTGLPLEISSDTFDPELMRVFVNGQYIGQVKSPIRGDVFGLFGQASYGTIKYSGREFTDAGTVYRSNWKSTAAGTIQMRATLERNQPPFDVRYYRANMPGVFVHPDVQGTFWIYDHTGAKITAAQLGVIYPFPGQPGVFRGYVPEAFMTAVYVGKADGTAGVFAKLCGVPATTHVGISKGVLAINPFAFAANLTPATMPAGSSTVCAEWDTRDRPDLIN